MYIWKYLPINYNKVYGISFKILQSSFKGSWIIRNVVAQHLKVEKRLDMENQMVGGKSGLHGEIFPRNRQDQLYRMF